MRRGKGIPAVRGKRISDADFRRLYEDRSMTCEQIGALLGISESAVALRAKARGMPLRGCAKPYSHLIKPHMEAEFARYWIGGVRSQDIADHYQTFTSVIARTAKRLGLPARGKTWQHRSIPLAQFTEEATISQLASMARAESAALKKYWKQAA